MDGVPMDLTASGGEILPESVEMSEKTNQATPSQPPADPGRQTEVQETAPPQQLQIPQQSLVQYVDSSGVLTETRVVSGDNFQQYSMPMVSGNHAIQLQGMTPVTSAEQVSHGQQATLFSQPQPGPGVLQTQTLLQQAISHQTGGIPLQQMGHPQQFQNISEMQQRQILAQQSEALSRHIENEMRRQVGVSQQPVGIPQPQLVEQVRIPQQPVVIPQQVSISKQVEMPQHVEMSHQRVEMSHQRVELPQQRVELSQQRVELPQQHVEMPQQRDIVEQAFAEALSSEENMDATVTDSSFSAEGPSVQQQMVGETNSEFQTDQQVPDTHEPLSETVQETSPPETQPPLSETGPEMFEGSQTGPEMFEGSQTGTETEHDSTFEKEEEESPSIPPQIEDTKNQAVTEKAEEDMALSELASKIKTEKVEKEAESEPGDDILSVADLCYDKCHCSKLMYSLINQRQMGKFCDVLIKTANQQIWAHKSVLSANSPYFDSFLLSTSENQEGEKGLSEAQILNFAEYKFEVLDPLIQYMYSGIFSLNIEQVDLFFPVIDKFLMSDLKRRLSISFADELLIENWHIYYEAAEKHDMKELSLAVSKFISRNISGAVKDNYFLGMEWEHIVSILKKGIVKTTSRTELSTYKALCFWISHDMSHRQDNLKQCLESISAKVLKRIKVEQFITFDLATLENKDILSHSSMIEWLETLQAEEVQPEPEIIEPEIDQIMAEEEEEEDEIDKKISKKDDDFEVEEFMNDDDDEVDTEDDLFIPGEELRDVTAKKTRSMSPRKRKSSRPQRIQMVTAPSSAGKRRGRPKGSKNIVKKSPVPKKKAITPRKRKIKVEADLDGVEVKDEPLSDEDLSDVDLDSRKRRKSGKFEKPCPICNEVFNNNIAFKTHMKTHGEADPFKCEKCSFQTTHYGMFTAHKRRKHREDLCCPKCNKEFPSQTALNHHVRGHGSDIPFLCDICGFTTNHYASMNIHKRRHNGKMLKCTYEGCSYESPRHVRLRDHLNAHLGLKNYICPTCGKAFGSSKHLSRHENIHKIERNPESMKLKCTQEGCTYETVRHARLRDHVNAHLGLKNHICTTCGKAFAAKRHLLRHENIHKTDKIVACEQCPYSTPRPDKIRTHIKRHHPETALLMGYLTEAEATHQIQKNLENLNKTPPTGANGPKKSPKKRTKKVLIPGQIPSREDELAAERLEQPGTTNSPVPAVIGREVVMTPLQAVIPHHLMGGVIQGVSVDQQGTIQVQPADIKQEFKHVTHIPVTHIPVSQVPVTTTGGVEVKHLQVAQQGEIKHVHVPSTAANTIVDMIHYFMAPEGASSEQQVHAAWNYHHSNNM